MYSFTVTDPSGAAAITLNADMTVREFTFSNLLDITLSGLTSVDYIVTVNADTGISEVKADAATFTLTLKNPCIDPNFVFIKPSVLLNQVYELHEHDPSGYQFTHAPFVIET